MATRENTGNSMPNRPALTDEGRENELIALAYDLVAERLRNGTATSQETTHFLKLGSTKERLEKEYLAQRIELDRAKKENLESANEIKELYADAIKAFKSYQGINDEEL